MQITYLLASTYGSSTYSNPDSYNGTHLATTGNSTNSTTSGINRGGVLTDTGIAVASIITIASIILLTAIVVRIWKRKPATSIKK